MTGALHLAWRSLAHHRWKTAILVASIAGLVFGLGWALATRAWTAPFGFGPAIAFGALFVLLAPFQLV